VLRGRKETPVAAVGRLAGHPASHAFARSLLACVGMVVLYYALPLRPQNPAAYLWLAGGLVLVMALLVWQVRHVMSSAYPRLRAFEAVATTLPLFLLVFAATHYLLEENHPGSYSEALTRTDALYFVITVFATVGFGDITPVTEIARVVTTVQMLGDLILVGVIARVLLGAVQVGLRRQRGLHDTKDDEHLARPPDIHDDPAEGDAGPDDPAGW
jgi:voltage-gated potassium channel